MTRITTKAAGDLITSSDMNTILNKIQTTNATSIDNDIAFPRYFNVKNYGGTNATAITNAGTAASAAGGGTVYFSYGTYGAASNVRLPTIAGMKFDTGAKLFVRTGAPSTIRGPFDAPLSQIFSLVGTGVVAFGAGAVKEFYPQWWGAKADGVTVDTTAARNAIAAIPTTGGVLYFPAGTYMIDGSLGIGTNDVQVVGDGNATILKGKSPFTNLGGQTGLISLNANRCSIKNLTIDYANVGGSGNIIASGGGSDDIVEACRLLNTSSFPIEFSCAGSRNIIRDCFWNKSGISIAGTQTDILIEGNIGEDDGSTTKVLIVAGSSGTSRINVFANICHMKYNYASGLTIAIDFLGKHCNAVENVILSDVQQTGGATVGIRLGHGNGICFNEAIGNTIIKMDGGLTADEVAGTGITGAASIGNDFIRVIGNAFQDCGLDCGFNVGAVYCGNTFYSPNRAVATVSGIRGNVANFGIYCHNTHVDHGTAWNVSEFDIFDNKYRKQDLATMTAIDLQGSANTNVRIRGNSFSNVTTTINNLGSVTSGLQILQNLGFNPQGVAAITVTASPFTYTNNDGVPEEVHIDGGTITTVVKNAITLYSFGGTAARCAVWLEPGEALTVTYTVAPTMNKNRA